MDSPSVVPKNGTYDFSIRQLKLEFHQQIFILPLDRLLLQLQFIVVTQVSLLVMMLTRKLLSMVLYCSRKSAQACTLCSLQPTV